MDILDELYIPCHEVNLAALRRHPLIVLLDSKTSRMTFESKWIEHCLCLLWAETISFGREDHTSCRQDRVGG